MSRLPAPLLRASLVCGLLVLTSSSLHADEPAAHPIVPAFERFDFDLNDDAWASGRLLLGELSCTSCHTADASTASILNKRAPVLTNVGARVRPEYLRQFIANPSGTKLGTSMPHMFAGVSAEDRAEQVDQLVHYLASTGDVHDTPAPTSLAKQGETLFHSVGCVACHNPRKEDSQPLATSVPLGKLEPKYTVNALTSFLRAPHRVRPSGRMPSLNLNDDEARKIACFLLKDIKVEPTLTFDYYEGTWKNLPDFSKLTPKSSGSSAGFDVLVGRNDNFGIVFHSFIKIDKDAKYRFKLASDDGSRLLINGDEVVRNDGIHPHSGKEASIELKQGVHEFTIEYFEAGGHNSLSIEIEGGGKRMQSVVGLLRKSKQNEEVGPPSFVVDVAKAAKGKKLFASIGCASCHEMKGVKSTPTTKAPALASLHSMKGCLEAESSQKHVPTYSLNEKQRRAIVAALRTDSLKLESWDKVTHLIKSFNCVACHERGKVGGVERSRETFFQTTQKEMGDEGRIPPTLTGVGGKLKKEWLKHVFDNGAKDRDYMLTRMPKFGADNVGELATLLSQHDQPAKTKPPIPEIADRKFKASGRHLAGSKAFSCVKCHSFGKHKATGIQAMPLTSMTKRLNEDWFHYYMLDPQAYRPGTRMPASWPKGLVLLPKVLDGQADTQVHALWRYLSDGERASVPFGVEASSMELVATDEAIIYRNFIEGAGPRAIGVGFPEKVNYAFDAQNLRLGLLWHNAFIDAAKHWNGRGQGFQSPLGDNVLKLPDVVSFAELDSPDAAWPTKKARELGGSFHGYRLDAKQRPTFLYDAGGVHVADTFEPISGKEFAPLRRTIAISADHSTSTTYYLVAVGKIKTLDGGVFEVDGSWQTTLSGVDPAQIRIRASGGRQELIVVVKARTRLVQEYRW